MLCPNCRAVNSEDDLTCGNCGADLAKPSKSLVPIRKHLPAALTTPRMQRIAAGVGVVAASAGLELLRRIFLARLAKSPQPATNALPTLNGVQDLLMPRVNNKLAKGYEVHEEIVYMRRVIRREH